MKPSLADIIARVSVRQILDELSIEVTAQHGDELRIRCVNPEHADNHPSLDVNASTGFALCRSCGWGKKEHGKPGGDVCKVVALARFNGDAKAAWRWLCERAGLNGSSNGSGKRIAATYDYRDEAGALLFQVVRFEPKDFRQRRLDGKDGWLWKLDDVRRVLYKLPELLAADPAESVFIGEGERDVDNLGVLGLVATTNAGGAGKWRAEYAESLRGRHVVILADNDDVGEKHARQIGRSLIGKAASVKLLRLPNLPDKGDVSDWLAAGGTRDELLRLATEAEEWTPHEAAPNAAKASRESDEPKARSDTTDAGAEGEPHNGTARTPATWFSDKYPSLSDEFGDAVLEEIRDDTVSVHDINEDFFAATLGEKGTPEAPTVFMPTEDKFYSYQPSDGIFVHQREPVLIQRLSREFLACGRSCDGDGCKTQSLQFRLRASAKLNGVLRKARGLLDVQPDFFSTDLTEFIPCANGMLRLTDKTLLSFSPSYHRRNKLAVPFDPSAECPLFLDVLMRPALDKHELDLLQRWCGLALVGENVAQKMVILSGTAGGGKGTFIRVLNGIIGQINIASLRTQLLDERFELGRFLGKTLLYGADVRADFLNEKGASRLKALTGGDPVTFEFKNSNESPSGICKFNVIVTCNSRLTVRLEGDTDAWRRRLAIIEYRNPKPKNVIADLDQKILATEGSGVLNWMLKGLDKLRADGWQLSLTDAQTKVVDDLLLESDGLSLFVSEALTRADGAQLTVPDAFAAYVEFCNQRGWAALTRNHFGHEIGSAVVRAHHLTDRHDVRAAAGKAQRGWYGLQLLEKNSQPTGKKVSELSEKPRSDTSDRFPPLQTDDVPPPTDADAPPYDEAPPDALALFEPVELISHADDANG